jgi:competence protein ComEC
VLGFAAAMLAPVWLSAATALAWLAGWPCRWLVGVADVFGGVHGAVLPWPGGTSGGLALLGTLAALWALARRGGARRVLVAAGLTAAAVLIPVRTVTSSWPPPGWLFVACDVGQGDALLLRAGPGAAVEIDAGPDPVAVDRCLRDFGIDNIPILVLSHYHLDHVAGLPGVFRGRSVARMITGPLAAPAYGLEIVHDVAVHHGLQISTPPIGARFDAGAVHLEVLGPRAAFHGTRSDPNNSSLVLRAVIDGVRILLPGDAEIEAQQRLLESGADLRADVLKVPHHGSAYSDPAFLAAVHAQLGVISVGLNNDYGHPSPILLDAMARLGVPVFRTDHDGDVAITGGPGALRAVVHGKAASTVGLGTSERSAWIATCPRVPPTSTTCPIRCPNSSCSWVTRSFSSIAESARSPPRPGAPMRPWSRPRSRAASCKARSCTSCWARRCSATAGCWWCARRRTFALPRRRYCCPI